MRTFEVIRRKDAGIVCEGVQFSDGTVVTRWLPPNSPGRSTVVWDSLGSFIAVHISPHPGNKTVVSFSDGEILDSGQAKRKKRK